MLEGFTWFMQSAFRWDLPDRTVYIDPWGLAESAPPADAIFVTHAHYDHLSPHDIERIQAERTRLFAPVDVAEALSGDVTAVRPGDSFEVLGIHVQAVPAYNTREERLSFHPKDNGWVGYVFTVDGRSFYHAGDTDHLEELHQVKADVAFVPIGGTYTMTAPEAAGFVRALRPGLAVPMHFGYVVGSQRDAEVFRKEAAPIDVAIMSPQRAWGDIPAPGSPA